MKLVIIEGEGKKDTIAKYLKKNGSGYSVFATRGHVRDLPAKTLAVDVYRNYEPKYVIMDDKKVIVDSLKKIADKADEIFLATDPDREGEAISWHLASILNIPADKKCRIVFNEISENAVAAALKNPRVIDQNTVDAQQARRVLDRLVGYKLSPVLCKKIKNKLSAGRVQSVALRMVVDREREILAFVPDEYWTLTALLDKIGGSNSFRAVLTSFKGKKYKLTDEKQVKGVLSYLDGRDFYVDAIKAGVSKSHAPAPYITSTLKQDALNKLGFTLKATDSVAQELYEGVELEGEGKAALITYIRTDSTRVSPEAVKSARSYIEEKFGNKYIPDTPNIYKSKDSAQDAHEAIRPISVDRSPESLKNSLNANQYKLYKIIYDRFLASQMSEAVFNTVTMDIACGDYGFRASGKQLIFDGYLKAFNNMQQDKDKENEEGENTGLLPVVESGEKLKLNELKPEQKFTKPPPRFTEASLVKAMEEQGIGRPATYTPTIMVLAGRSYTERDGKALKPTELGCDVVDMLVKYFPDIMNIKFTAQMETALDSIDNGGRVWQDVIDKFYNGFEEKIAGALGDGYTKKAAPEATDILCQKCNSPMILREGRYGKFLACSNYPACKNILNEDGSLAQKAEPKLSGKACVKCGKEMVIKTGRSGEFLACPGYPKCKHTENVSPANAAPQKESQEQPPKAQPDGNGEKAEYPETICSKCGAVMVVKQGRFGPFYACPSYPECKNIVNIKSGAAKAKPEQTVVGKCPDCGKDLVQRTSKKGSVFYGCKGYPKCTYVTNELPGNE